MSATVDDVLKEALRLPEPDRARVVAALLASLEPDTDERDDDAWIAEIERRAQAALGGEPGRTWEQTRAYVEERVSQNRK